MNEENLDQQVNLNSSNQYFPLILLLFFGSGCAALIYEVVWFQLIQLVIGSSAVSIGVLLGTYMGGMCLGSLAFPRIVSAKRHPLRVYAVMELLIGIIGVAVLFGVPSINKLYIGFVGHGMSSILLRGVICAICLLPPTFLMGATLPAIARWVESTPKGVSWLGFFYGGNIAGAVLGCLLAGFYLLRVHDMAIATYTAVAIDVAVFAFGMIIAKRTTCVQTEPQVSNDENVKTSRPWLVYISIAISGLTALGSEVVWTRLLSLMLGATVYTFSIILAVFLTGLGIGSSIASMILRSRINPRAALGVCQLMLVGSIAYTAYMLTNSLPFWPINQNMATNPWMNFQLDILRCFWAVFPGALFWGASFPLALGAASIKGQDTGKLVGGIYAANTVGAIIGSVAFSMLAIPVMGTQNAQRLLIILAGVSAMLMLLPPFWPSVEKIVSLGSGKANLYRTSFVIILIVTVSIAGLCVWSVDGVPWQLVAEGRFLSTSYQNLTPLYYGEGMNASIAITELIDGTRNFHVSGKIVASSDPLDMKLQLMLGHLPSLINKEPKSVLVVGCGAGVTAGSFLYHPGIEEIVICEIEPLIPKTAGKYFGEYNHHVIDDPRVTIIYDDARHYVLTTEKTFDIITSDPIHPWVKGAAALYTEEYFEMCKERLNPGGIVTQWVPLYESTFATVKSEIATFFKAFPDGSIWGNDYYGKGYDIVLLGWNDDIKINVDEMQARLNSPENEPIKTSLQYLGFNSAVDFLSTYAGQVTDLEEWLSDAFINRDTNLRLQYLAGMGLNLHEEEKIYEQMLENVGYPEDLFIASEPVKQELMQRLE
ncbi:MAG: fused MFS/spermidine synthase [Sedimentisphaerales bacterium]|nr:fused MFS/spermidine synthase [Sedimentisphaerales bacterium]